MCGDSFYAIGHGVASSIARNGPLFLPPVTREFLDGHDVVVANIEAPLSDAGRRDWSLRSLHMRGRPTTAHLLASWGISVGNLANNHVLEHGADAAGDTARNLRRAGIVPVGSGTDDTFDNAPVAARITADGIALSIIGACTLNERYAHQGFRHWGEILELVAAERATGRIVVVTVHWGRELVDRPGPDQIRRAYELSGAGASVIAGHHPHVAQGVVELGGTVAAFSLGNFVFNGFVPDTRWTYALSVELDGSGVVSWTTVPVVAGPGHEPIVHPGSDEPGPLMERVVDRHRRAREAVAAPDPDDRYDAEADRLTSASRVLLRRELVGRSGRYPRRIVPQILARPVLRRVGLW